MGYVQTYSKLWLCSLNAQQRDRTCGYWYTITSQGGTPHTAFRTRDNLLRWLDLVGLKPTADIPQHGEWSSIRLDGTYRTEAHLHDADKFTELEGTHSRTLSNGDYVQSIVTTDPYDGFRTVHTLNPNVKGRLVYDYRTSSEMMS